MTPSSAPGKPGPASIWRLVQQNANPIVTFNGDGDGPRVYCIHSVTGDVGIFATLADLLGPGIRFFGIQVPNGKMNAAFGASVEGIARHHVEALVKVQPQGPIILGGFSAGAIIALEMAQQLRAMGRQIPLLVALDGAPTNTGAGLSRWHPLYAWNVACNLPRWLRKEDIRQWSIHQIGGRLVGKLVYRGGQKVPFLKYAQTLESGTVQNLLAKQGWLPGQTAFIRALYDAMAGYQHSSYAGRVLVYETITQPLFQLLQVGPAWRRIATDLQIVPIAGTHSTMLMQPTIGQVADHLRITLADPNLASVD